MEYDEEGKDVEFTIFYISINGWGQKNNLTCCPICMKNKEENT